MSKYVIDSNPKLFILKSVHIIRNTSDKSDVLILSFDAWLNVN